VLTLSLSTSSAQGSLCLGTGGKILGSQSWLKQTSHSEKITEALQTLLLSTKKSLQDIEILVCTHGPGSFTGIRVGLSVVRSLAHALHLPVIVLDDCWAIALNAPAPQPTHQLVVIDAQKNKVFAGIYIKHQAHIKTLMNPTLLSTDELSLQLNKDSYLLMGDGDRFYSSFDEPIRKKFIVDKALFNFPQAQTMYHHVFPLISTLPKVSWNELEPLYLKVSAAEELFAQKIGKPS
jgi:tRNA threonylcarbamoyladenosine biosynthesis protein TsaB